MTRDKFRIVALHSDLKPRHISLGDESAINANTGAGDLHFDDQDREQLDIISQLPLTNMIDLLGEESARAQALKRPITTSDKFTDPVSTDMIYMVFPKVIEEDNIPEGFIRIGSRDLYLHDSTCLRLVRSANCVLDFYSRRQREGIGHILMDSVSAWHSAPVAQWAFDRPSGAMLNFLRKHYTLTQPLWQYNHFVIFSSFSFQPRKRLQ